MTCIVGIIVCSWSEVIYRILKLVTKLNCWVTRFSVFNISQHRDVVVTIVGFPARNRNHHMKSIFTVSDRSYLQTLNLISIARGSFDFLEKEKMHWMIHRCKCDFLCAITLPGLDTNCSATPGIDINGCHPGLTRILALHDGGISKSVLAAKAIRYFGIRFFDC